eukprot:2991837-Rhodomonas_salina.1
MKRQIFLRSSAAVIPRNANHSILERFPVSMFSNKQRERRACDNTEAHNDHTCQGRTTWSKSPLAEHPPS